jgi:hypothetical protein
MINVEILKRIIKEELDHEISRRYLLKEFYDEAAAREIWRRTAIRVIPVVRGAQTVNAATSVKSITLPGLAIQVGLAAGLGGAIYWLEEQAQEPEGDSDMQDIVLTIEEAVSNLEDITMVSSDLEDLGVREDPIPMQTMPGPNLPADQGGGPVRGGSTGTEGVEGQTWRDNVDVDSVDADLDILVGIVESLPVEFANWYRDVWPWISRTLGLPGWVPPSTDAQPAEDVGEDVGEDDEPELETDDDNDPCSGDIHATIYLIPVHGATSVTSLGRADRTGAKYLAYIIRGRPMQLSVRDFIKNKFGWNPPSGRLDLQSVVGEGSNLLDTSDLNEASSDEDRCAVFRGMLAVSPAENLILWICQPFPDTRGRVQIEFALGPNAQRTYFELPEYRDDWMCRLLNTCPCADVEWDGENWDPAAWQY